MKIQAATKQDLPRLLELGRPFSEQENVRNKVRDDWWLATWSQRLDQGRGVIFYQTNGGPEPVGLLGGCLGRAAQSGELEAREMFWYVDPEHRGHGGDLLEAFEAWAEVSGAKRVWMSRLEDDRSRVFDRVYARKGYRKQEVAYAKELTDG